MKRLMLATCITDRHDHTQKYVHKKCNAVVQQYIPNLPYVQRLCLALSLNMNVHYKNTIYIYMA